MRTTERVLLLLEDQGDGWWHCPSPLTGRIIDGPAPRAGEVGTKYVVVECDDRVEWNGDDRYIERWGPDHPLCHPIEPTTLLLVLASSAASDWHLMPDGDWSVPAAPVVNGGRTVESAGTLPGLGMKVRVRTTTRT